MHYNSSILYGAHSTSFLPAKGSAGSALHSSRASHPERWANFCLLPDTGGRKTRGPRPERGRAGTRCPWSSWVYSAVLRGREGASVGRTRTAELPLCGSCTPGAWPWGCWPVNSAAQVSPRLSRVLLIAVPTTLWAVPSPEWWHLPWVERSLRASPNSLIFTGACVSHAKEASWVVQVSREITLSCSLKRTLCLKPQMSALSACHGILALWT